MSVLCTILLDLRGVWCGLLFYCSRWSRHTRDGYIHVLVQVLLSQCAVHDKISMLCARNQAQEIRKIVDLCLDWDIMYYANSYAKDHIKLDEAKVLRHSSVQNFMFSSSVFSP